MIYIQKRIGDCDYDEYDAKVVRANTHSEARRLANVSTGDEGAIWENESLVTCEIVETNAEPMVILESFNAG